MAGATAGLGSFLQAARRFPLLTEEQERACAEGIRARADASAMRELVGSHLRLVTKIARGFAGYGLPLADLVAAGNLGLMRAVKGFDPSRGVRFATYASWWIRAEMQEFILQSWSLVSIAKTAPQKRLFFHLRSLKARLGIVDKGELAPEAAAEIGRVLHAPEEEVKSMNGRLSGGDLSLNAPIGDEDGGSWDDLLVDGDPGQEETLAEREQDSQRRQWLRRGLSALDRRERAILVERRLRDEPPTLDVLAQRFGVSRERIRQIETRAFEKLRQSVIAETAA
ncbi:MAG TPA: RNA polymerase factor sigma-32 [Stellaceae bacterium]|nr:RNA polymerase factor sigma-32 [Stellaceae bacterium]